MPEIHELSANDVVQAGLKMGKSPDDIESALNNWRDQVKSWAADRFDSDAYNTGTEKLNKQADNAISLVHQGYFGATLNNSGRGFSRIIADIPGGIGAVTGIDALSDIGKKIDAGIDSTFPVNPTLADSIPVQIGGAAGMVGNVVATGGVGGVVGKSAAVMRGVEGLEALNAAAHVGSELAVMTPFALGGAKQGAETADQYGITGGARAAMISGYGALNLAVGNIGLGNKTAGIEHLLGNTAAPAMGTLATAGIEAGKMSALSMAQNALLKATAPDGSETPDLLNGSGSQALSGAIAGTMFGGFARLTHYRLNPDGTLPPPGEVGVRHFVGRSDGVIGHALDGLHADGSHDDRDVLEYSKDGMVELNPYDPEHAEVINNVQNHHAAAEASDAEKALQKAADAATEEANKPLTPPVVTDDVDNPPAGAVTTDADPTVDNSTPVIDTSNNADGKTNTLDAAVQHLTDVSGAARSGVDPDSPTGLSERQDSPGPGTGGESAGGKSLASFAQDAGLIIPETVLHDLEQKAGGNEHDTFVDPEDPQWRIKVAGPNLEPRNGRPQIPAGTEAEYLRSHQIANQAFGDGVQLLGVMPTESGPRIVIRQPEVEAADPANPHPDREAINAFLRKAGFEYESGAWIRHADGLILSDDHEGNFIQTQDGIRPIDLHFRQLESKAGTPILPWANNPANPEFKEAPTPPVTPPVAPRGSMPMTEDPSVTGVAKDFIHRDREASGLPPITLDHPDHETLWNAAVNAPQGAGQTLMDELRSNPDKVLTMHEVAQGLHEYAAARQQTRALEAAVNSAPDETRGDLQAQLRVQKAKEIEIGELMRRPGSNMGAAFNALKMLAQEDYTLPSLLSSRRAGLGRPLTIEEAHQVMRRHAELEAATRDLDSHDESKSIKAAADTLTALQKERADAANAFTTPPKELPLPKDFNEAKKQSMERQKALPISAADKARNFLDGQIEAARKRQETRRSEGQVGFLPVQDLFDTAIIAAGHIAKTGVNLADFLAQKAALGFAHLSDHDAETVYNHGREILDQTQAEFEAHAKAEAHRASPDGVMESIKERMTGANPKLEMMDYSDLPQIAKELARAHEAAGANTEDSLTTKVHADLTKIFPELTKRQARDAFSDYGRQPKEQRSELEKRLAELRRQSQLVSSLEDAKSGKPPLKTGKPSPEPSATVRDLTKQVKDEMRKQGIETDGPEQLKTAQDAITTRLKNQVEDLTRQLHGEASARGKTDPVEYTPEMNALMKERNELAAYLKDLTGPNAESEWNSKAEAAAKASAESYRRRAAQGDLERQYKPDHTPNEKTAAAMAERDAAKAEWERLREAQGIPAKEKLQAYKNRLDASIEKYQKRIDSGDYAPKKRAVPPVDEEVLQKKATVERKKLEIDRLLEADRLKNRSKEQKIMDATVRWRRAFLLSGFHTLGKLSAAAAWRLVLTPVEEAIGSVVKHLPVISKIAEQAPRHGYGLRVSAESAALTDGVVGAIKKFGKILKTGKSDLDANFGKKDFSDLDPSISDTVGHLHTELKAPAKMAEFHRSFQHLAASAMEAGVDVYDPVIQEGLMKDAYLEANKAIFMQENFINSGFEQMIHGWETSKKFPEAGPRAAALARVLLPIVKVPTNVAGELAGGYILGLPRAAWDVVNFMREGMGTMDPKKADLVMRNIKKGAIGAAVLAYGFYNYKQVGGFYHKGEKRKPGEPEPGDIKVGDVTISHMLLHTPAFAAMQMGADMRHVAETIIKAKPGEPAHTKGSLEGAIEAAMGIGQTTPFFQDTFAPLRPGADGEYARHNFVKGLVPLGISQLAADTDPVKKRTVKTVSDAIKSAIPGLRQTLKPAKSQN